MSRRWSMLERSRDRDRHHPRQGVVLLVVVACILIAGLAMVAVARQSLRLATDSIESERELQRRWGLVSVQRSLLKNAPAMFDRLEKQARLQQKPGPYPGVIRSELLLGGVKYDVVLADENAKVNLNLVYHLHGKSQTQRVVGQFYNAGGLPLRLVPEVPSAKSAARRSSADEDDEDEESPPPPPAFRHWGQVFDLARSQSMGGGSRLLPTATSQITCWGRGQVNIARASDKVLKETCGTALGPGVAQRFIREYRDNPLLSVQQIAQRLDISDKEVLDLRQLVSVESSAFSLWVNVSSVNRSQLWFAVSAPVDEVGTYTERFSF